MFSYITVFGNITVMSSSLVFFDFTYVLTVD